MNILGITLGHDTSLSLVVDGVVVGTMDAEPGARGWPRPIGSSTSNTWASISESVQAA